MDAIGAGLIRLDEGLFHLSNVLVGVAVFVAAMLYAPPGSRSVDLLVGSLDPFYVLAPFSVAYACWSAIELYRWRGHDDVG
jgi:hypothetical protein